MDSPSSAAAAAPASPATQAPSNSTPTPTPAADKALNLPDTPASADPETPFSDATPCDAADADAAMEGEEDDGITNPSKKHMTLAAPAPASKKAKKKTSNSVWTKPASRKGKKKGKQPAGAGGAGASAGGGRLPKPSCGEDEFVLTPAPRLAAERNDDGPDLPVLLSRVFRSDKVEISDDRLTAACGKGYRMARATRGVAAGAWYFEIKVVRLGPTGHTRLGWATNNSEIHGPIGYDMFGFAFRDTDGAKVHRALRSDYAAEGYVEGDVIGFYIHLPDGEQYEPKKPLLVQYKGMPFHAVEAPKGADQKMPEPDAVPGSEICFFKNGVCQGTAFLDIPGGRYYPAASMYTLPNEPTCEVRFNFGPDFEFFPEDFGGRPVPQPMNNVPYQPYELKNEGPAENGMAEKTS